MMKLWHEGDIAASSERIFVCVGVVSGTFYIPATTDIYYRTAACSAAFASQFP